MTELPELIEDPDGAPLPPELQRDGVVWQAIRAGLDSTEAWTPEFRDLRSDEIAEHLAPVLWPWLPQNTASPIAERDRLIRVAIMDPGRFTARADESSEGLWRWQARAVGIVLDHPDRARAAL